MIITLAETDGREAKFIIDTFPNNCICIDITNITTEEEIKIKLKERVEQLEAMTQTNTTIDIKKLVGVDLNA